MASLADNMRPLAQKLPQDYETRVEAVADRRFNVKLELNNYRTAQQAMAGEQEKVLDKYMDDLHSHVNKLRHTISSAHQEMASQQAQELSEQFAKLRHNAATFLKATDAAHRSMATAQKQSLVKGRNQLMAEVTATREENHSDIAEAAKIWASISQAKLSQPKLSQPKPSQSQPSQPKQKNRTKKGSAKSSQAAESA